VAFAAVLEDEQLHEIGPGQSLGRQYHLGWRPARRKRHHPDKALALVTSGQDGVQIPGRGVLRQGP